MIRMFKLKNLLKFILQKNNIHLKLIKKAKMIIMKLLKKDAKKSCFSKTKFLKSIMKITQT